MKAPIVKTWFEMVNLQQKIEREEENHKELGAIFDVYSINELQIKY